MPFHIIKRQTGQFQGLLIHLPIPGIGIAFPTISSLSRIEKLSAPKYLPENL